ncbi:MAG: DUF5658 family protein [Halobacteriales archaeon]|nr:DUF5658 family protein [Halobacteriales archaeon]
MASDSAVDSDGHGWLGLLHRKRELTRTHTVLWTVILIATATDIVLTMVGLERGFKEANVVVAELMGTFGLAGLWLVKFAAMLWLVGGWALLSDRNASIFLGLFGTVTVGVVVHNAIILLV